MLAKIGEVATKYEISNRTLRYWEEEGILSSVRMENGYRYYDEANIARIKKIIMFRKLRLPIQDIQSIFLSNEISYVVSTMQKHLEETMDEAEELEALSVVIENLIYAIKSQKNLENVLMSIDLYDSPSTGKLKDALRIMLSERDNTMSENSSYSKLGDVRIVNLPKMVFASYRAESTTPEDDCWKVVNKFIEENSLCDKNGFRQFGFNNPDPSEGNPVYGYEMWVVIPEDLQLPIQFTRKEFNGGLFAAVPAYLTNIGERWGQLWDWVNNSNKYEIDWDLEKDRRWFEECIDYIHFSAVSTKENEKQLDLLAPIKIK